MNTDALCAHLRAMRESNQYAPEADGYGNTDEHGNYTCEISPAADLARQWARELLDAAEANGLHGCRLCQS